MQQLYERIFLKLTTIDYEKIYPGFHLYPFALYNDKEVCLDGQILSPAGFYGNTTIKYENRQIAIWNVENPDEVLDEDEFASNIVHEMFHAFQMENDLIMEAPNDLKLLRYPQNEQNYLLRQTENELLADSVTADFKRKSALFHQIEASREVRKMLIQDFLEQEYLIENLEGSAECCGMLALKQLSEEKYQKKLADYACILKSGNFVFDIRKNAYYSGTLMELLKREVVDEECELSMRLKEHIQEAEKRMETFFNRNVRKTSVEGFICGYDPMNQIRVKDNILATGFMMMKVNDQILRLDGPVVVKLKEGSDHEVEAYFQTIG